MFSASLLATFRILFFKAGPQDFPFDQSPRLTRVVTVLALLANVLFLGAVLPPVVAVVASAASIAAMALVIRLVLGSRKMLNRFQQTFNAMLATSTVLTLAMTPGGVMLAPVLIKFYDDLDKNPDLAQHPELWPHSPEVSWASTLIMLLMLWQFAVTTRIFRQSAEVTLGRGLMAALMMVIAIKALSDIASSVAMLLGH